MSGEGCCCGKCWQMGPGERWFWRTLLFLTAAAFWYFLAINPGARPLERVAPGQPQPAARAP